MSTFTGTKLDSGHGIFVANFTSSAGTDVDDAVVEASTVKCRIISISMASSVAALSVLAIKNAALDLLVQAPVTLSQNYVFIYPQNCQPELNGLVFDSPTIGASAVMGFSVTYQK